MSTREWLAMHYYSGDRSGQELPDLWSVGVAVDLTLDQAHKQGGQAAKESMLAHDDRCEH